VTDSDNAADDEDAHFGKHKIRADVPGYSSTAALSVLSLRDTHGNTNHSCYTKY
jgi:hypothetical protein